jgi:hypothetical protein
MIQHHVMRRYKNVVQILIFHTPIPTQLESPLLLKASKFAKRLQKLLMKKVSMFLDGANFQSTQHP